MKNGWARSWLQPRIRRRKEIHFPRALVSNQELLGGSLTSLVPATTALCSSSSPSPSSLPTMKGIHSSLYRVRSNSLTSVHRPLHTTSVIPLTFFDSPPPPLRPGVLTSPNRLPTEHPTTNSSTQQSPHSHGGHAPLPLALGTTAPNSSQLQSQYALFTYSSPPQKGHPHPQATHSSHELPLRAPKRQRLKYQLDVGAYGIPKKAGDAHRGVQSRLSHTTSGNDDLSLAVQVGEDAYFVRDNAMGIADGVGGWTRAGKQGQ